MESWHGKEKRMGDGLSSEDFQKSLRKRTCDFSGIQIFPHLSEDTCLGTWAQEGFINTQWCYWTMIIKKMERNNYQFVPSKKSLGSLGPLMARPIHRFLGRPSRCAERWFAVTDGFIWAGQSLNRAWKLWQGADQKWADQRWYLFLSVHESRGFPWTYEPWLSNVFAQEAIFDLQELILQRMHFHRCFIVLTYHKISIDIQYAFGACQKKLPKHFPPAGSSGQNQVGPEKANHVPLKHR